MISSQLANDSISVVHRYEDLFDGIVKGIDSAESCFLAGGLDNTVFNHLLLHSSSWF